MLCCVGPTPFRVRRGGLRAGVGRGVDWCRRACATPPPGQPRSKVSRATRSDSRWVGSLVGLVKGLCRGAIQYIVSIGTSHPILIVDEGVRASLVFVDIISSTTAADRNLPSGHVTWRFVDAAAGGAGRGARPKVVFGGRLPDGRQQRTQASKGACRPFPACGVRSTESKVARRFDRKLRRATADQDHEA